MGLNERSCFGGSKPRQALIAARAVRRELPSRRSAPSARGRRNATSMCDLPPSSPGSRSPTGRATPTGTATTAARRPRRHGRAAAAALVLHRTANRSPHLTMPTRRPSTAGCCSQLVGDPFVIGVDQADRDAQVRCVGDAFESAHPAWLDALRGECHQCRTFVGDRHPEVDSVCTGHTNVARPNTAATNWRRREYSALLATRLRTFCVGHRASPATRPAGCDCSSRARAAGGWRRR